MEREAKLEKSKFYFIDYVRAFAAIIIINSHFDSLYPVPVLATGGAIGNALFFAVSGFCLWPIKNRFGSWYAEKIIRLYIPTLIMTLISIVLGTYSLSLQEYIFIFIWPTLFWFIGAIILFYPLYYFIQGVKKNWHFALLFFILFIVYFLYYFLLLDTSVWTIESGKIYTVNGFFRLIYYFVVMMIGKYFRINVNKTRRYPVLYILYIFIGGGSLYFIKFLMNRDNRIMHFQCLNQFSVLLLVIGVFLLGLSIESYLAEKSLFVYKICKKIGTLTLYFYIVQFRCIGFSERFCFPVNMVIAVALIGISAVLLQLISETLFNIARIRIKNTDWKGREQ